MRTGIIKNLWKHLQGKKWRYMIICIFLFTACKEAKVENKNDFPLQSIAEQQAADLNIKQLINGLLLYANNDSTLVCYALVMPKQTLIRLVKQETYPKPFTMEKVRESFVKAAVNGIAYLDSCAADKKDSKDWLIKNSVNEPINPIWEQITEER